MRAIIIGAGKVGFNIAQMLSKEGHDVVIIEKDEERQQIIQEHLDIQTICGSGSSCDVLEEAGVREAKMVIAVTEMDELNMVACLLAKQYGVPQTIARVRNPEYMESNRQISFSNMGIDLIINPERVTAYEIAQLLENPEAKDVEFFVDGKIQVAELKIEANYPVVGNRISQLKSPGQFLVVAIIRNGQLIVPGGEDSIQPNDLVFVISRTKDMARVERLFIEERTKIENVVILGGGRIGYYLAQLLEKKGFSSVKVIEKDRKKCKTLASRLNKTLVINGDGTDTELLSEENIGQADAFVAVTGDDKLNLLVSLLAKNLGAKKTFAQVRRGDLIPLLERVDIDTVVSPRMLTAGAILRFIRRGEVNSVTLLGDSRAEMIELTIPAGAPVTNRTLREIELPKGTLVGAVKRGEQIIIPGGDDSICPGDQVMIFTVPNNVPKIEALFVARRGGRR